MRWKGILTPHPAALGIYGDEEGGGGAWLPGTGTPTRNLRKLLYFTVVNRSRVRVLSGSKAPAANKPTPTSLKMDADADVEMPRFTSSECTPAANDSVAIGHRCYISVLFQTYCFVSTVWRTWEDWSRQSRETESFIAFLMELRRSNLPRGSTAQLAATDDIDFQETDLSSWV